MHGEIGVDSPPRSGSTFWFQPDGAPLADAPPDGLPVGVPDARSAARTAPALPWAPPPDRPWRVLCIEDKPVNLMAIEALLNELPGLSVQGISSAIDGLASALAEPPDLALLDIQMPGLDGFQVLAAVQWALAGRSAPR